MYKTDVIYTEDKGNTADWKIRNFKHVPKHCLKEEVAGMFPPREHFWAALLLTIIVVSLVIVIIFIIINACISKKAAWYSTEARPNHYDGPHVKRQNSQVQHKDFDLEKPPLPSREQFKSVESVDQGYEDLEPASDYVEVEDESNLPVLQQSTFPSHFGFTETKSQNQDTVSEDYDDVEDPVNEDSEDYDDVA